jgi:uncharacterized membrane protein YeaQ/YmgE (transglycosylase-associated protein family)
MRRTATGAHASLNGEVQMQYLQMQPQQIWACLAIGLVFGLLAGQVLRGKFNLIMDIVLGVAGAMLSGYLFNKLEMVAKAGWIGIAIFAAIGAGAFLVGWRSISSPDA